MDLVDFGVSVKTAADINQLIRSRRKTIPCSDSLYAVDDKRYGLQIKR